MKKFIKSLLVIALFATSTSEIYSSYKNRNSSKSAQGQKNTQPQTLDEYLSETTNNYMDIITPDRLSNIDTSSLLKTADNIKKYNVLLYQEKELILNKIFTALSDRDFKFEKPRHLWGFLLSYYDNTKAMNLLTPDRLSNLDTFFLITIAKIIKHGSALKNMPKETRKVTLNQIFTTLKNRDFKFEGCSLKFFILAYYDNTTAMDFITSGKLSNNIPTEQLESSVKLLNDFLPRANPSEKENIRRVIDIIDQKLLQISQLQNHQ